MGVFTYRNSCGCQPTSNTNQVKARHPNDPDPSNFEVLGCWRFKSHTIAKIKYPGCINFEGEKIIIFEGLIDVVNLEHLDPHFLPNNNILARFVPTQHGTECAHYLVAALEGRLC